MTELGLPLAGIAALSFIAINLAAFAAFGIDKRLAEAQERRISEATLLQLAFFGGSIGAYAGRQIFRHKNAQAAVLKQSFPDSGAASDGPWRRGNLVPHRLTPQHHPPLNPPS